MRKKRLYLIIYLFIVAILVFGNLTLVVRQWESSKTPIDGFSDQYIDVSINQIYEIDMTLEKLVRKVADASKMVRVQKLTDRGYAYVYLSHATLPVQLVSGRNFEERDFTEHKNVALVDTEMEKQTYEIDGTTYFVVEGQEYEVIGIFKKEINDINPNTSVFVNLLSEQLQWSVQLEGRYLMEGVSLPELEKNVGVHYNPTIYEIEPKIRWNMVSDTLIFSIQMIGVGMIFCGVGLIYMIYMWLNSVNPIIDVAIICGATTKRVAMDIMKEYFIVLGVSGILPSAIFLIQTKSVIGILFVLIWVVLNLILCGGELILMRTIKRVYN